MKDLILIGKREFIKKDLKQKIDELLNVRKNSQTVIVNAGLLKAGKSTLFNAILGEEKLASGVIRETVKNEKVKMGSYVLVDTPGLDACEKDDKEAFSGYKEADILVFVHNLIDGELSQIEIDALKEIESLYGGMWKDVLKNVVLVLTCKDQQDDYCKIKDQIEKQCKKILGYSFEQTYCVDSVGYLKGKKENKKLLIADSGIEELKRGLEKKHSDNSSMKNAFIKNEAKEIIGKIDVEIEKLEKTKRLIDQKKIQELEGLKSSIKRMSKTAIDDVMGKKVDVDTKRKYKSYTKSKDYKEYDSEYSAKSAAKSCIEQSISKVESAAKRDALSILESFKKYLDPSGIPSEMRDKLSENYDKMRRSLSSNEISVSHNLNIIIKRVTLPDEFEYARDSARSISLRNANYYLTNYSSNLFIDYDYRTKWVRGLFGASKEKKYKVYNFDASGAADDVADDATEFVSDIFYDYDIAMHTRKLFSEIQEDMISQFEIAVNGITKDIETEYTKIKNENANNMRHNQMIDVEINELKKYREKLAEI